MESKMQEIKFDKAKDRDCYKLWSDKWIWLYGEQHWNQICNIGIDYGVSHCVPKMNLETKMMLCMIQAYWNLVNIAYFVNSFVNRTFEYDNSVENKKRFCCLPIVDSFSLFILLLHCFSLSTKLVCFIVCLFKKVLNFNNWY